MLPLTAYASEHPVQLENHDQSSAQAKQVSGIVVDGVDAPQANTPLDTSASVGTAEGESWDIGVLWVRNDLQFATGIAEEGRSYLPVLAYFTPGEYALDGNAFTVTLSDSLTKLFGTNDIVSVYSEQHGITYIMPASLISLFMHSEAEAATPAAEGLALPEADADAPQAPSGQPFSKSLVDVYCAKTARDHFTDEDLEWIIDLIVNSLEPQAVELLLDSFPVFREAANNGQIGTRIGLHIYYAQGDNDISEHETMAKALAYVSGAPKMVDGTFKYSYLLAVNLESLAKSDLLRNPIANPSNGKYMLLRNGMELETLINTTVHELFHALMDDYNRTAMVA